MLIIVEWRNGDWQKHKLMNDIPQRKFNIFLTPGILMANNLIYNGYIIGFHADMMEWWRFYNVRVL